MTSSSTLYALAAGVAAVLAFALAIGALERTLPRYRSRFRSAVSRQLARSHVFVDAGRLLVLNVAAIVVATSATLLLTASLPVATLAALACGVVPRVVLAWVARRRRAAFRAQLSDLMLLAAGGLRAGLGLPHALEQTAREIDPPARQELGLMLREQRLGATFDEALDGLERRMPLEETALLAAALRISRETGGNLAETLETLGDAIRRKTAIEGKINALTSQARLQGWAMGLLPLAAGFALWLIEPVAMSALFQTRAGLAVCACVALMQLLGLHFLRRIVRIDV